MVKKYFLICLIFSVSSLCGGCANKIVTTYEKGSLLSEQTKEGQRYYDMLFDVKIDKNHLTIQNIRERIKVTRLKRKTYEKVEVNSKERTAIGRADPLIQLVFLPTSILGEVTNQMRKGRKIVGKIEGDWESGGTEFSYNKIKGRTVSVRIDKLNYSKKIKTNRRAEVKIPLRKLNFPSNLNMGTVYVTLSYDGTTDSKAIDGHQLAKIKYKRLADRGEPFPLDKSTAESWICRDWSSIRRKANFVIAKDCRVDVLELENIKTESGSASVMNVYGHGKWYDITYAVGYTMDYDGSNRRLVAVKKGEFAGFSDLGIVGAVAAYGAYKGGKALAKAYKESSEIHDQVSGMSSEEANKTYANPASIRYKVCAPSSRSMQGSDLKFCLDGSSYCETEYNAFGLEGKCHDGSFSGKAGRYTAYLYDSPSGRKIKIGSFYAAPGDTTRFNYP